MTQLGLANARVHRHITKFWALPSTYVGVVFLSIGRSGESGKMAISWCLALVGALLLVAMKSAHEGATRAIRDIRKLEAEMGLQCTFENKPFQFVPYVLLCILGITYSLLCAYGRGGN